MHYLRGSKTHRNQSISRVSRFCLFFDPIVKAVDYFLGGWNTYYEIQAYKIGEDKNVTGMTELVQIDPIIDYFIPQF